MNPLVASVIRTLVPVAVGQVASWLLLLNITLPLDAQEGLGAFLGGLITAIYYVAVRIVEQQWPAFGVLLGLPKSPDTYSAETPATVEAPVDEPATDVPAKVGAHAAVPASADPVIVTPVYTPPTS